jgi:hypothetical protein
MTKSCLKVVSSLSKGINKEVKKLSTTEDKKEESIKINNCAQKPNNDLNNAEVDFFFEIQVIKMDLNKETSFTYANI